MDERKRLQGYRPLISSQRGTPDVLSEENLPDEVDWSAKGACTEIKQQSECGSCWAFSATGAIEGARFIKNGELVSLSEQQLVDCSSTQGNRGCNGGNMDWAFDYVKITPLDTEKEYPYNGNLNPNTCTASGKGTGAITDYKDVTPNSVSQLKAAIAIGPVAVGVEGNLLKFMDYAGGVITEGCGKMPNHGVLAVGYGTDPNYGPFFKIKNEWGPIWGEDGYARIAATDDNVCGILAGPSYPVV